MGKLFEAVRGRCRNALDWLIRLDWARDAWDALWTSGWLSSALGYLKLPGGLAMGGWAWFEGANLPFAVFLGFGTFILARLGAAKIPDAQGVGVSGAGKPASPAQASAMPARVAESVSRKDFDQVRADIEKLREACQLGEKAFTVLEARAKIKYLERMQESVAKQAGKLALRQEETPTDKESARDLISSGRIPRRLRRSLLASASPTSRSPSPGRGSPSVP